MTLKPKTSANETPITPAKNMVTFRSTLVSHFNSLSLYRHTHVLILSLVERNVTPETPGDTRVV